MTECPTCGTSNPAGAKFCAECGSALGVPAGQPARETRKHVTVLFADVAGSTALGEELDPETLRALMGRYFAIMKRVIESHGGTVEKFIGDAVMAVFGVPVVHEDDALRAVRAAAVIRTQLGALDAELGATRGHVIRFRTGINTGEVVAGGSGAEGTLVTGDAVNTAARLEQAAQPGEILLGHATWRLVHDAVTVEPTEPLAAKGKSELLPAYRLIAIDPDLAGHLRRLDTPLVGREREMAALQNALDRVASERSCQLFTLLGSAGVGKSRLVAEFTAGAAGAATILRGRCLPYGEGITYWPIGEIVRAAAGIEESDTAQTARAKLRATIDGEEDADIVSSRVASAIGLSRETVPQEEVFWAIRRLFEHVARERPLVVVVEDIHWAESTLLDLIEDVADWSRDVPLLLLCPARPDLLDGRTTWGGGKLNVTTVLLEPLGAAATASLVAELPGGAALSAESVSRILTAGEGNPLFIEEMLRMLADEGLLAQSESGTWIASESIAQMRIPASISALLSARLERLAPDERSVAERASVVGRVFEQAAVAELVSPALRPEVGANLMALVRKELVRPDRSELSAGAAFKFRHILIRDAAYEALPKLERAILHESVADWLVRTAGGRLAEYEEIVGHHLEAAYLFRIELGDTGPHASALAEQAATHLAAAGGRALDRGDLPAAERLLSRAASSLPIGSQMRLALLPDVGFALYGLGRISDAEALLDSAVEEAKAGDEPRLAVRVDLERALLTTLAGAEHVRPRKVAEASIPVLARASDEAGLGRAYLVIAMAAWLSGSVAQAVEARDRAFEHSARASDDRIVRLSRSTFWGAECYGPAPATAAIDRLEAVLATVSGDPMRRAETLFSLSGLYAMRGRAKDARAAYRDVSSTLEGLGARRRAYAGHEMGGSVELLLDDPGAANAWLQDGIDRLEDMGNTASASNLRSLQIIALARQGRSEAALRLADRLTREMPPEDHLLRISLETGRAIALCADGDAARAVSAAREAVRLADATDWSADRGDALMALAEALAADGDATGAVSAATRALDIAITKENLVGERRASAFLAATPDAR